jgi:hypothetical protein
MTDVSASIGGNDTLSRALSAFYIPTTGEPQYGMPMSFYAGQSSSNPAFSVPQGAAGLGGTPATFSLPGPIASANSSAPLINNNQSRAHGTTVNAPTSLYPTGTYYVPPTLTHGSGNTYGSWHAPAGSLNSSLKHLPYAQPNQTPLQNNHNVPPLNSLKQQQPIAQDRPVVAEPHAGIVDNLEEKIV